MRIRVASGIPSNHSANNRCGIYATKVARSEVMRRLFAVRICRVERRTRCAVKGLRGVLLHILWIPRTAEVHHASGKLAQGFPH